MIRDYAANEKNNLRLLATINIIKPFVGFARDGGHKFHIIFANIHQFWVYNVKTGEIYSKIKI